MLNEATNKNRLKFTTEGVSITHFSPASYPDIRTGPGYALALLLLGAVITDTKTALELLRLGWPLDRTPQGFELDDASALGVTTPDERDGHLEAFDDLLDISTASVTDAELLRRCNVLSDFWTGETGIKLPSTEQFLEVVEAARSRFLMGAKPHHYEAFPGDQESLIDLANRFFGANYVLQ